MQLGENIAILVKEMEKKQACDFKPDPATWKCNLSGDSTALAGFLGNKPTNATKESELLANCWPSQAHHLIPHVTLAEHTVTEWLKEGARIYGDTKYNVDHRNNGVWLPFASSLAEWKTGSPSSRRSLMLKVMGLAGLQLHQGPHSATKTFGVGLTPYKTRVKQYLSKIEDNAISHFNKQPPCDDCKGKKQNGKGAPRDNTVRYVDKASSLLLKDIASKTIFVSRIAAELALAGGL